MIDSSKYKSLLDEVFGLMQCPRLSASLKGKRSSARVDAVQDIMRDALVRSSVSRFNGTPYYFGGKFYEPMSWDDLGNLVYDLMRLCNLPDGDYSRVESVFKVCKRAVSAKSLKPDNAIMVFNNCVLDMNTRLCHPFSRDYVQVTGVDYDYNPSEHVFLWKSFLDEVLPDRQVQVVLQEFLGSIFVDRSVAKMETMVVLRGSGSNGKSVVFETVVGILGRENVSNFGIGSLISGAERKKNVAFINGKRLNYCSEIQAMEFGRDSDSLKALISGEPTEARPLYGENFTAYNIPLLMANANHMPYLKDWSYGMRRRICIIPFEVEIPLSRQRRSLARDMEEEYPAIFNWILEGRDRFVANGYKLSGSRYLERVMDEYQSESSSVMSFMFRSGYLCRYDDVSDAEPVWVPSSKLYGRYQKWCTDNDLSPENVTVFGRILSDAGYRKRRTSDGSTYAVYGEALMQRYNHMRNTERGAKTRVENRKPVWKDGKRLVYTVDGIAEHLHISRHKIARMMDDGNLDGAYHMECRTTVFDLDEVKKRLKAHGVFDSDSKRAEKKAASASLTMRRKSFNSKMRSMKLPYRKYLKKNQGGDGVVQVPDDWEYSEVNAALLEKRLEKRGAGKKVAAKSKK